MKKSLLAFVFSPFLMYAQEAPKLTDEMAMKLSDKPLHCINQEYPNKTAHIINNADEVPLTPKDLHPSFYGCFDWHSSVHGHWMLTRLLKTKPNLSNAQEIEKILDESFQKDKMQTEADYFTKYQLTGTFERTYGWAWILKLDEELTSWDHPKAKIWHQNLKPLTDQILKSWKTYLPKQTYPNRTGVHPNTAFAMAFAIDWARANKDKEFENQLMEKAKYFFLKDQKTPAYLEPDGSDFFSPSLEIADLMRRVLPQKEFVQWLNAFYEKRSLENIEKIRELEDEIDIAEGRLRFIDDRVNYSTLNLNLYKEKVRSSATSKIGFGSRFIDSLTEGWNSFVSFLLGMVSLWPFFLIIPIIVFFWRKWKSKKKSQN